MARYAFKLPDIGEGISEAEIVAWHVAVGDRVEEDQPLVDMMTDKATVAMESPVSGTVTELAGQPGDQVAIGATLAVIEAEDHAGTPPAAAPRVDAPAPPPPAPEEPAMSAGKVIASPAVRARARALGIDLAQLHSADGRIRHGDLDAYLLGHADQGYHPAGSSLRRPDEEVRVIGLRRRIAENMAASKKNIPHFSYVEEIDVTELEAMRANLNAERGDRPRLSPLPFLIVAICRAVQAWPMMNARYDDAAGIVTRHGAVHMGVATQTDAGLMVPVVRDAQDLNIWQLADEIARLAEAARSGQARPEELTGSTLSITSLGPLGGIASTPVINRPEVAIIGPNRIVDRPVLRDGALAVAKLMNLSISCDHRVVDGWDAASFVRDVKRLLETPVLLFAD
ncbi:MAG TPA: dihydrolipoamide acetyltransferase family protein [Sphingobium sp.]|nr:dihydrolipoamide acetyltransferase family protein [Sphingobium sp.]